MPAKAKPLTLAEQAASLKRQTDEVDLARIQEVRAIFNREEVQQAIADLKALSDPTDTTATHRSAGADANALLANALVPFFNVPLIAATLEANISARLNPPEEPTTAAVPVPDPSQP